MMECPVLPDVGQLSSHQSAQQYVLANTVRILTLEEQNVDLRKQLMAPTAHRAKPQQQQELDNPIRLWQDIKQQPCCTVQPISSRMRSFRGRLGHLVDALNHSQLQAWSDGVTMCSLCDRMFYSDKECSLHEQYCTTL